MISVVIDGNSVQSMDEIHDIFSRNLDFPDYYGRNLDALYDCLGDIADDICIVIQGKKRLAEILGQKKYGFYQVLQDIYEENPYVDVLIEEDEDEENGGNE